MKGYGTVGRSVVLGALLLLAAAVVHPAVAQTREQAFAAMMADPNNPDHMLRFARLAIEDGDYESALATLERFVDIYPEDQDARFELAAAYFALGADEAALYHIQIYQRRATLNASEKTRADGFEKEIDGRGQRLNFGGSMEGGMVLRSDSGQVGVSAALSLDASYALAGPQSHDWRTSLRLFGLRYGPGPNDDVNRMVLRTGPSFSLDGTAFGDRLQPYFEFQTVETGEDQAISWGAGLSYSRPINPKVGFFSDLQLARVEDHNDNSDSTAFTGQVGFTFRPQLDRTFRLSLHRLTDASDFEPDSQRSGIRLGYSRNFADPITPFGARNSLGSFVRYDLDETDGAADDEVWSWGVNFRTQFESKFYVDLGVNGYRRIGGDSDSIEDDTLFNIGAGWEF